MKTRVLLLSAVLSAACSAPMMNKDAGTDAGEEQVFEFAVSGTASMHPLSLGLLTDAGASTSMAGLTARVEEPLRIALSDPTGVFSSATLTAAATFNATKIPSDLVNLGVGVGIRDNTDAGTPRVVPSAMVVYDVGLHGGSKPSADIANATAFGVPTQLHDALTAAVTPATITALTSANGGKTTLLGAGFVLGRILTAAGAPVTGATIVPAKSSLSNRIFYPSADLKSLGTATSANGVFLYVHTGGDVDTFRFTIADKSEYLQHTAGANKDSCLVVDVYPGVVP